jgi:hypothetical protein
MSREKDSEDVHALREKRASRDWFLHSLLVNEYLGYLFWIHQYYKLKLRFYGNGGLFIIRKKEPSGENRSFICPNPTCGRVFDNPIKAENHSARKTERYDACPYCLTDLTVLTASKPMNDRLELESDKAQSEPPAIHHAERKLTAPPAKMKCTHEFGYLSKRGSKGEISEECMMCENIVQCMLKT